MNSGSIRPRASWLGLLATALFSGPAMSGKTSAIPITDANYARMPRPHRVLGGYSPADFGMSRECAKQRRKNKLRRHGIGGDRR